MAPSMRIAIAAGQPLTATYERAGIFHTLRLRFQAADIKIPFAFFLQELRLVCIWLPAAQCRSSPEGCSSVPTLCVMPVARTLCAKEHL
jgi:hypothetical protein